MRVRAKERLFHNNVLYEAGKELTLNSPDDFNKDLHEDVSKPVAKKKTPPPQAHMKPEKVEGEEEETDGDAAPKGNADGKDEGAGGDNDGKGDGNGKGGKRNGAVI